MASTRKQDVSSRYMSCEECKPSTWTVCKQCGKYYCKHKGRAICDACIAKPRVDRVITTYAGPFMTRIWQTEYGNYRHQTNVKYYRQKDANEWLEAAKKLDITAHLRFVPHYVKWHDWRGRPCGMEMGWYELWVLINPTDDVRIYHNALKEMRHRDREQRYVALMKKPRAKWEYKDHEDYHRMMGTL